MSRFEIGSVSVWPIRCEGYLGSVRSGGCGRKFGEREAQLPGHFNGAGGEATKDFGMTMDESGAERERQQQNERDCGQSLVGNGSALRFGGGDFGAMPTGVEKAMLESPV